MQELNSIDILEYIPQRPPIVMVGGIREVTEVSVITTLLITEDNIFCKDGSLQEPGLIENIAQSAAAMEGYNAKKNGEAVKIGFIGAVKALTINKLPKVGTSIETSIQVDSQVMDINIVKGQISQNGEIIAECTLNIFLQQ